ncbi:PEP-CTERM sorting domain-containing protein [Aquabacterium sp. A7-Y]|uniref:PEP-CTERM sorting domain-containing protein n=1 Tax=Aquabacterium sp. A7-Y TaxID=1349605 RepID=UPI00223E5772|nr:PEP-CTERM sorting domain-containing protein [Aquabacterium sp. A7-Y]MCW7541942.1 PEP-CTERM sorting domain-containing protein [Aquabacterium sp. A7-Y]
MITKCQRAAAAALLALAATAAHAVPMAPHDYRYVALPGTTAGSGAGHRAGTVLEDETVRFSYLHWEDSQHTGMPAGGSIQSQVVRTEDGTLDFYWRITTDADSAGSADIFRLNNFYDAKYSYDIDFIADGPGSVAPRHALMMGEESSAWARRKIGDIDFYFNPSDLSQGRSSYYFFIDTDATSYAKTATASLNPELIFMAGSGDYGVFAPVPEPSSMALLAGGVGLLAWTARRRAARRGA